MFMRALLALLLASSLQLAACSGDDERSDDNESGDTSMADTGVDTSTDTADDVDPNVQCATADDCAAGEICLEYADDPAGCEYTPQRFCVDDPCGGDEMECGCGQNACDLVGPDTSCSIPMEDGGAELICGQAFSSCCAVCGDGFCCVPSGEENSCPQDC